MATDSFVKNWRSIEGWKYYKKDGYAHLWQHLVRKAQFKERYNGFGQLVQRGQLDTSLRQLSDETGVTVTKCNRILKELETEHQIKQAVTSKNRIITIVNYEKYQGAEQETKNEWNTSETLVEHERNNFNKVNNENKERSIYADLVELIKKWNSLGLQKCPDSPMALKEAAQAYPPKEKFGIEGNTAAFENYSSVLTSPESFYTYQFKLVEFLRSPKSLKFYPGEFILNNFLNGPSRNTAPKKAQGTDAEYAEYLKQEAEREKRRGAS